MLVRIKKAKQYETSPVSGGRGSQGAPDGTRLSQLYVDLLHLSQCRIKTNNLKHNSNTEAKLGE